MITDGRTFKAFCKDCDIELVMPLGKLRIIDTFDMVCRDIAPGLPRFTG